MQSKNFSLTIVVGQSPQAVFNAINNVRGWWSENIEGDTNTLHAEFSNRYKDVHYCSMKITTLVPNKKVVWHVMDSRFNFTKNKNEWQGNDIIFDITSFPAVSLPQAEHDSAIFQTSVSREAETGVGMGQTQLTFTTYLRKTP